MVVTCLTVTGIAAPPQRTKHNKLQLTVLTGEVAKAEGRDCPPTGRTGPKQTCGPSLWLSDYWNNTPQNTRIPPGASPATCATQRRNLSPRKRFQFCQIRYLAGETEAETMAGSEMGNTTPWPCPQASI